MKFHPNEKNFNFNFLKKKKKKMLSFLIFLLVQNLKNPFHVHQCTHDFAQDKLLRSLPPEKLRKSKSSIDLISEEDFKDIRIIFNVDTISGEATDSQQCTRENFNQNPNCQGGDILKDNYKKRQGIISTIQNIQKYLEGLIQCRHLMDPIEVSNYPGFYQTTGIPSLVYDCDLYIVVVAHPYGAGSTTLAQATTIDYESTYGRAILGEININANALDDIEAIGQSESSADRSLFTTVLHELNHILSFSSSNYNRWYDSNTLMPYQNLIKQSVNRYNITQQFLSSPGITEWINKRFYVHSDELTNLGLELEDGGSKGTAYSHPNSRLYFTDLMQGRTYGVAYITPMFFIILEDTGWYKVNQEIRKQREEEFVYMDVERFTPLERSRENLLVDPPQYAFPSAFQCTEENYAHCFYDYRQKAVCAKISKTELEQKSYVTNSTKYWYNPENREYVGQEELVDHADILLPSYINCRSEATRDRAMEENNYDPDKYGETYGINSICAESTLYTIDLTFLTTPLASCYEAWCGTDYKVRLVLKGKEYLCKEDGQRISISGYNGYIICPPGKVVCASMTRRTVINMNHILPTQGPTDGQNLISIEGSDFNKYDDLDIKIGPVNCSIAYKDDNRILCQVDSIAEGQREDYQGKYVSITASSPSKEISTTINDAYYFTTFTYSAGFISSAPTLLLLVFATVFSFFV